MPGAVTFPSGTKPENRNEKAIGSSSHPWSCAFVFLPCRCLKSTLTFWICKKTSFKNPSQEKASTGIFSWPLFSVFLGGNTAFPSLGSLLSCFLSSHGSGLWFSLLTHSSRTFSNRCLSPGSALAMSWVQNWHSRLWNTWVTVLPGSTARTPLIHLVHTHRNPSQVFLSCLNMPLCFLLLAASFFCLRELSYSDCSCNYLTPMAFSLKILVKGLAITTQAVLILVALLPQGKQ